MSQESCREDISNFKNFHKNLCKRFGYHHDEIDWQRDLASIEEFIAELLLAKEREAWNHAVEECKKVAVSLNFTICSDGDIGRDTCGLIANEIEKLKKP